MTETTKYRVHAFLRTLSPMHIASPEAAWLNTDTMRMTHTKAPGTTPCTAVQKMPIPAMNADGGYVAHVPVIAANNIMGRLRRHGAAHVLDALVARGDKVSIRTYSAITCGAVTGNPDGRDVTFDEYRETREHPYIGLFGGGPRMMRRYVRTYNAVPVMKETEFMFARFPHPYLDEEAHYAKVESYRLFGHWTFRRNDDLRDLVDIGRAAASIENFGEEIIKRQAQILSDRVGKEADDGGASRNSTKTWSAFEFVVPGVIFPLVFELDVTEAQLGLFLSSLDSFSDRERLGGHVRNGFGLFALDDVLLSMVDEGDHDEYTRIFDNSRLSTDSEIVANALSAWSDAAAAMRGADLDRLLAAPELDANGKKGKK
jgi:CRISPR type IV-associated protein Csf2